LKTYFYCHCYAGIGNFVYGIPVSFLADYISHKLLKYRFILAGFIHIFFGAITTLIIGGFGFYAIVSALLFFISDEWQNRKNAVINKKMIPINAILLLCILVGVWGLMQKVDHSDEKTNNIYLIPKGYEGSIITFYNVADHPRIKKQGEYNVIPVKEKYLEALKDTEIYRYGIALTSTPDRTYGEINDKYYYVDSEGKKTPINEKCVHTDGYGSFTGVSEIEVGYRTLQITKSDCGEDFWFNGKEIYYTQENEVKKYWMNVLD
jgi:hypothetical protein